MGKGGLLQLLFQDAVMAKHVPLEGCLGMLPNMAFNLISVNFAGWYVCELRS